MEFITGFLKVDMIGQNLQIFQPKCISDTHGEILKNFLENDSGQSQYT
jgi:hypothetical protein